MRRAEHNVRAFNDRERQKVEMGNCAVGFALRGQIPDGKIKRVPVLLKCLGVN